MRILSWNVNGLRACEKKGFSAWLEASGAEIVAVQEVRALPEQLPEHLQAPPGWHVAYAPAERKGYSGVGIFSRTAPDRVETSLGAERFDVEGRLQLAHFGRLVIANGYFPNGNGKDRDNSRIPYKLDFYRALYDRLDRLRRGGRRVLVLGDFNTAHRAIDLARPKSNVKTSGFRPEEREELDRWIAGGWVDTFRHFEEGPDHYSWWSQRFGVRERNVGWRIDYVLASQAAMRHVRAGTIHHQVMGSDHCPVGVEVDPAIRG
ncbi:MAG: exodeoxyribonuclease III [Planctomycetota bacterium]|nr:exodeoxyribonuclease III [Planctomycetota bacterium]